MKLAAFAADVHSLTRRIKEERMPKMTDSRRKKIQARQRQVRAAVRRERKAARRAQRREKTGGRVGPPRANATTE